MKLRPYQKQDYKQLKKELKAQKHILFGACTGYGKSAIIYKAVKDSLKKGKRVLIIAPRRKLVKQLTDTVRCFSPSVLMGADTEYNKDALVYVASTPTLASRLKTHGRKYLGDIGTVIIDEAHQNFGTASMSAVTKLYWDKAQWIGLSATPIDDRGYRLEGYDHTIYNHQTEDLIDIGFLTPIKVMVEDTPQGLDTLGMVGGDYNERELGEFMSDEARVNNIYSVWKKYAKKRKTMIFTVNIAHAEIVVKDFKRKGVAVAVTHSKIDEAENERILQQFKHGHIKVLVNVSQLTTGFDEPSVDAIIMARPTKSLRLFLQMTGRVLRIHKGKKDALFLDVAGTIKQHHYPTMRRDFNKMRPPAGASEPLLYNDMVCPHCEYEFQPRNAKREVITEKLFITTRTYCPNCEEIVNEVVVDTKKIKKMKLIKDFTNVKHITDSDIGEFMTELQAHKGYKNGWVQHTAKLYNRNDSFKNELKILCNKYRLEMIKADTAINNLSKIKKEYE